MKLYNKLKKTTPFLKKKFYSTNEPLQHSLVKSEKTFELSNETIGYRLSKITRKLPYSNAFKSSHQRYMWSYNSLKQHVEGLANGLIELGLRVGDRVGYVESTNAEHIVTVLAVAKAGGILVEFKKVKNENDLARYMDLFRPTIVMLPTKEGKTNYWHMLWDLIPELATARPDRPIKPKRFPFCKQIILTDSNIEQRMGVFRYKDAFVYGPFGYYENPLRRIAMELTPDHACLILQDNEDINKAKPIVFSHRNLLDCGTILGKELGVEESDRVMVVQHLNEPFGAILGNFTAFTNGATLVYPTDKWEAKKVLELISIEKITVLFAKVGDLRQLLIEKEFENTDFSKLRVIVVDGTVSSSFLDELKSKFECQNIVKVGGLYETSGLLTLNDKVIANTEMKIVRPKDGKILKTNTHGFLKVRGPTVAKKYWNDIGVMNDRVDEDGWLQVSNVSSINETGEIGRAC